MVLHASPLILIWELVFTTLSWREISHWERLAQLSVLCCLESDFTRHVRYFFTFIMRGSHNSWLIMIISVEGFFFFKIKYRVTISNKSWSHINALNEHDFLTFHHMMEARIQLRSHGWSDEFCLSQVMTSLPLWQGQTCSSVLLLFSR